MRRQSGRIARAYNSQVDFRFKYRRQRPAKEELAREVKEERDVNLRARQLAIGLSIPASLISGPLFGYFTGKWLDDHFHTGFWMITMIFLGLAGGFKMVFDQITRLGKS